MAKFIFYFIWPWLKPLCFTTIPAKALDLLDIVDVIRTLFGTLIFC